MSIQLQVFPHQGCPIHYGLLGPEDAPLVVLTHGGMVDHRIWQPQLPALAPHYRVLVWDVRGHGLSRPGGRNRSIVQVAEDLAALLDHIGSREATLVGLSAGGWLVQELAYRHPDLATALVVAGQTSWLSPPLQGRLMASGWLSLMLPLILLLPWSLTVRTLMKAGAEVAEPQTTDYLNDAFGQWTKGRFVRHAWYARGLRSDPKHRVTQPLLIIHGEREMAFVRHDAAAWAAREPLSRYEVIPDAGHVVNMDNAAAFNRALLDFLAGVYGQVGDT